MRSDDIRGLERAIAEITEIAQGFGLDFYPMRYEICPADIIYTFGAYGMPTRFSHWSFGKVFHSMKTQYDYGLSKIYELVINSDPCYAFLLDGNSLIQNKLIVAHVLAHCDFFKNNARFRNTNRNMVESMAATAERIRRYEIKYGTQQVEQFLDAALAIQEHVDPSLLNPASRRPPRRSDEDDEEEENGVARYGEQEDDDGAGSPGGGGSSGGSFADGLGRRGHGGVRGSGRSGLGGNSGGRFAGGGKPGATPARGWSGYEDLWELEKLGQPQSDEPEEAKRFPVRPEKDVLWFIQEYADDLKGWQRDILTMLRDEMLYFWPQMETKIMNEGWASYWHIRIMRELDLTPEETIEFAKLNSAVVQPSRHSLNPYYLGLKMFEDIEKRWDDPTPEERDRYGREPGQGRTKMFEVRELDSDTSFVRSYFTKQLVEDLDLYLFEKKGSEWKITGKSWENIRDQLVYSRVNGGFPYIVVEDGDYNNSGELFLKHRYEGIELDLKYVERTLPYVQKLWGRPVHLETLIEDKAAVFTYDGKKHNRKFL